MLYERGHVGPRALGSEPQRVRRLHVLRVLILRGNMSTQWEGLVGLYLAFIHTL